MKCLDLKNKSWWQNRSLNYVSNC